MNTLEFRGDCRNYLNGNGASGKLIITDDKIVFQPSSINKVMSFGQALQPMEMKISDIVKCEKKLLGFMNIYDNHGNVMKLNMFKKSEIIAEIENRMKKIMQQK